ncbi:MAG TPA: sigma 54-interacting transcriptional regulator [Terriglobales bacterium]|nr:sigma 54-interacting transcriptional regulator [Terriglobales bacterium]
MQSNEGSLSLIINTIPTHIYVLNIEGSVLYVNQAVIDYTGLRVENVQQEDYRDRVIHPEDFKRVRAGRSASLRLAAPFSTEQRVLGKDGQYRWFLVRYNPLLDEQGSIVRWYVAAFDIEDRKRAEAELSALKDQLHKENLILRDEVDRASMFEEIVGTSPALQPVLTRIAKVAPTDSTALITGETGTGKELVARAIHRRSRRSARAFVSVNCAAVPRELIASELFGHEKGAFTGAMQRRLGRFELAAQGTIFLDEVGELPAETQVALLRVLQEREFERVGGTTTIRADVRVIAATNRDLETEIAAGRFRSDLFYRLNVFPLEVPPLRDRREDIPLLVEYFLDRYARKAGKSFATISNKSLQLLQSYPWPGNIRELQNVIERSVIVSETKTFSVDESWLSRQAQADEAPGARQLSQRLAGQEKEMIEAALRECGGRVSGPTGAANRLGMPGSTLESKIKSLKINKNGFKL